MTSIKAARLLIFSIAAVSVCAIVPALAGDARRGLPDSTVNSNSASSCAAYNNAGSGPGLTSNSGGGNGFIGSTTAPGSPMANVAGVVGYDSSSTGTSNAGVFGSSTGGFGVSGSSMTSNGVVGNASSGTGVYGSAVAGIGVYGNTMTGLGGVFGSSPIAGGIGVDGGNSSDGGTAIQGVATGNNASASGVIGILGGSAPTGQAVFGLVPSSADNTATAVLGVSQAANGGAGVLGLRTGEGVIADGGSAAGNTANPALGVASANGGDSVGVFNTLGSAALETFEVQATTQDAKLCKAAKETPPCNAGGDVYITGDVHVKGTITTTKIPAATYSLPRSRGGGSVTYHATVARSARAEDDGEAQLQMGRAYVPLDPDFAATIDLSTPYVVFVTPEGDRSMYVSTRTPQGFMVREIGGGHSNTPFAYRILASTVSGGDSENGNFRQVRRSLQNPKHVEYAAAQLAQRSVVMLRKLSHERLSHPIVPHT